MAGFGKSLFTRIFLWIWVLLILVTAANILTLAFRDTASIREDRLRRDAAVIDLFGASALDLLERGDTQTVAGMIRKMQEGARLEVFLAEADGTTLAGPPLPPEATAMAARAWMEKTLQHDRTGKDTWIVLPVRATSGRSAVAAARIAGHPALPPPFRHGSLAQRFVIAILLSGLVAWLLARSLARPIQQLKGSARHLAEGNLQARVATAVTGRGDEIGELGREFDLMADRIQSLVSSQRRLLRDISHELRSPLSRLGVALELARQKAGPEAAPALERIERESARLNGLIGQLLALSSLESGLEEMTAEPVELALMVGAIAADADFEARSRNRGVLFSPDSEITVMGRPEMLHRAIENVVRNGVRHTAEGTTVKIAVGKWESDAGTRAIVTVRDHGPGVPEAALRDIFLPFFRAAEARERESGGTGIGLAITERSILLHGGKVTAANADDGGLIVTIDLPA